MIFSHRSYKMQKTGVLSVFKWPELPKWAVPITQQHHQVKLYNNYPFFLERYHAPVPFASHRFFAPLLPPHAPLQHYKPLVALIRHFVGYIKKVDSETHEGMWQMDGGRTDEDDRDKVITRASLFGAAACVSLAVWVLKQISRLNWGQSAVMTLSLWTKLTDLGGMLLVRSGTGGWLDTGLAASKEGLNMTGRWRITQTHTHTGTQPGTWHV